MPNMRDQYMPEVRRVAVDAAKQYGLAADKFIPFLDKLIQNESSWDPNILGSETKYGKAQGLFQMIPDTAKRFGVADRTDARKMIEAYVPHLAKEISQYGYERTVQRHHGGTDPRNYGPKNADLVRKVLGGQSQGMEPNMETAGTPAAQPFTVTQEAPTNPYNIKLPTTEVTKLPPIKAPKDVFPDDAFAGANDKALERYLMKLVDEA